MPGTTITISGPQRDGLYELARNHLGSVGDLWDALERDKDFATAARLGLEFGEDFELLEDIGWGEDEDRESFELTMPIHDLTELLKRLHDEAEQVLHGKGTERQAREDDRATEERYLRGLDACEELLGRLDSSDQDEDDPEPISGFSPEAALSHELATYIPVTDGLVLAAVERAVLHEQEEGVLTSVLMAHLGLAWAPPTNQKFFPRLDELRQAGLLTSTERRGEPYWSLTSVGQERLTEEREAGEVGALPESPQHRAWRHARTQAAVRIEGFRDDLSDAHSKADDLLSQYRPVMSKEWFELSEWLHSAAWRLASATYCLTEWLEPEDHRPDVDENPGPKPGRRNVAAWDTQPSKEQGDNA